MSHVSIGRLITPQGQTRRAIRTIKLVGNANRVNAWLCWGEIEPEWCWEIDAAPAPQDIKNRARAEIPHSRQLIR